MRSAAGLFIVDVEDRCENGTINIGFTGRLEVADVPVEGEPFRRLSNDLPCDGVDRAALALARLPGPDKAVERWLVETCDPRPGDALPP